MTHNQLRVGILGLGAAANHLHLPACAAASEKIKLVGGCDISPEGRQKFKQAEVFSSLDVMLERTTPDLLIIATPPSDHLASCLLAIEAKCHIFCEKPFVPSLADADKIISAAHTNGVHVSVNNQFRYMDTHRAAFQAIDNPGFGELRYVLATQTFRPSAQTEKGWRGDLTQRTCFEFGIHVFDLLRYFFKEEPISIFASMPKKHPGEPDLLNTIHVEFSGGKTATIILDRLSRGPEHYLDVRLDGEYADITTSIGGRACFEIGMHTAERRPYARFRFAFGGVATLKNGRTERILAKNPLDPIREATKYLFSEIVNALINGEKPPSSAEDNRHTLSLVIASYDSAKKNRPVLLSSYTRQTG